MRRFVPTMVLGLVLAAAAGDAAHADTAPHGGLFRDPDVGATHVVFVYGGRLWRVPREGGTATPLAGPAGRMARPKLSPDGAEVAFVAEYDGEADIYVLPATGGVPKRVTWHPTAESLDDWLSDGRLLFTARGIEGLRRQTRLYRVGPWGGLPEALPVPYGAHGAIDDDWLAYNPHGVEAPTWKRYQGGRAPDLWLFHLRDRTSKRLTDWDGSDVRAMWHEGKVVYLSDRGPSHRMNLWIADPATGSHRQLTSYTDADVRWPSMGPGPEGRGEIVFQLGTGLHLLDLGKALGGDEDAVREVPIRIPGDRPDLRPQPMDVSTRLGRWHPSPQAKRCVVSARGDLWSLPARKGAPRNLTRTSGVAERDPAWSPDGKWIAYVSDESGEYELWIRRADGKPEKRRLTEDGGAWRFRPVWSPDSKRVAFTDKSATLWVTDVESGETQRVDADPAVEDEGVVTYTWSPDGRWLAYVRAAEGRRHRSLFLWDGETGTVHQPTAGMFEEGWPAFDRKGDFLYFTSTRHFSPLYSDVDETFIYANSGVLMAVPLRDDVASPFLPESDEVETDEAEAEPESDEAESEAGDAEVPDAPADGLSGTWEGEAQGSPVLEVDAIEFQLVVDVADDGKVSGSLVTSYGNAEIVDGSFDRETGVLELSLIDDDGLKWRIRAEVDGTRVTGTATFLSLGLELAFEGRYTAPAAPAAEAGEGRAGKGDSKRVDIDLDGFEARAFRLPVKPGGFRHLAVAHDGALLYGRTGMRGAREPGSIHRFDMHADEPKEQKVAGGSSSFVLSADGKRILVRQDRGRATLHRAAAGDAGKPVPTAGMTTWVDPREEWRQTVTDAWRILRDYFYDPHMHGVDWDGVLARRLVMLDDAVHASDVQHLIQDMLGELNVGHANYFPPRDPGAEARPRTGMLGCDFELADGAYRIARILRGGPWDDDARGPLAHPGLDVEEGDWVLAVNGVPVDASRAPWAAFQGMAGRPTWLTVSDKPELDEDAREVLVQPIARENMLRYRDWVERNRRRVEELSDGQVGYVHVPNTGWQGQNELFRQIAGQLEVPALIIDERWNGGGQIPTRFVELLDRPLRNYWARRDGRDWQSPWFAHHGPKCMLINGNAGSGGDAFPWYFRQSELGPLIGMRTWGGLVGMSGNPGLVDGAWVSAPTFAFYETDGTWGIEGYGVDPDIEVLDDPAQMQDGGDPQLERAVREMVGALERDPPLETARPPYPDRKGMGIPPADR